MCMRQILSICAWAFATRGFHTLICSPESSVECGVGRPLSTDTLTTGPPAASHAGHSSDGH